MLGCLQNKRMKAKTPSQSLSITTEIVLPNDTNNLDNLMGGRLLHWMDIATAIAAHRHCGSCLLYTSPSPRDRTRSRMPSSA